jgi:DNA-binding GntR family transcriptional regulator
VGITDAEQAISEHQAVLDAMMSGDPEKAAQKMTEHVEKVRGRAIADAPAD